MNKVESCNLPSEFALMEMNLSNLDIQAKSNFDKELNNLESLGASQMRVEISIYIEAD